MSAQAFRNHGPDKTISSDPWHVIFVITHLDGLSIEFEAVFGGQKLLDILALIALELDHLAHLAICNDCAIASYGVSVNIPSHINVVCQHTEFLLDDLKDLLLVELFR